MKWPKTYHLPSSLTLTADDKRLDSVEQFAGKQVIITEKLDGECTSLHFDLVHARSESSGHQQWRSLVKSLHAQIRSWIPQNIQLVGENVYAMHSIFYDSLTSYFYLFSVIDKEKGVVLSVDEILEWAEILEIPFVPILYRGIFRYPDLRIELWPDAYQFVSREV